MIVSLENTRIFAEGLDHPECVCFDLEGNLYAGGEAGQIYRISESGTVSELGSTGGFILGVTVDGRGQIHACDMKSRELVTLSPEGHVLRRLTGSPGRPFTLPNSAVFAPDGSLYVSDSGDYWLMGGSGSIHRVAADGKCEVFHAGPFAFANGLAIDPSGEWLYIAQTTAGNVARIALDQKDAECEVMVTLPAHHLPDGLAFASDGSLLIACYRPDIVFHWNTVTGLTCLAEDTTSELLNRPTNVALRDGSLYVANLGGWHISEIRCDLHPGPVHYPKFSS